MTRKEITTKRASILLLLFITIFVLAGGIEHPFSNKTVLLFFGVTWIICLVFWLSYEKEWSEDNRKNNEEYIQNSNSTIKDKSGKSFYRRVTSIAAICTILATLLLFAKECS
ncbi:MAG: hypothetical protein KAQ75_13735 [Bacteroidales bacterium]|nr:hypothetical protein [Bacteroidales bacterium]